jgi:hypothetical protein
MKKIKILLLSLIVSTPLLAAKFTVDYPMIQTNGSMWSYIPVELEDGRKGLIHNATKCSKPLLKKNANKKRELSLSLQIGLKKGADRGVLLNPDLDRHMVAYVSSRSECLKLVDDLVNVKKGDMIEVENQEIKINGNSYPYTLKYQFTL